VPDSAAALAQTRHAAASSLAPTESSAHAAFAAARAAFAAAAAGRVREHHFVVGDTRVAVRCAGRALEPVIVPALTHLSAPPCTPEFTVLAWDSASTGVDLPALRPERRDDPGDGRVEIVYQRAFEMLTVIDHDAATALMWVPDARAVASNEIAAPLRVALHLWSQRRDARVVHGAAVGSAAGGVLIAGRSGIGKSTAALSCLAAGFGFLGDDYVLVKRAPTATVASLYCSAKLNLDQLHRFPELHARLLNPERIRDEKPVYLLGELPATRRYATLPLGAIVVPRVTGGTTRVVPASPAAILTALAPSTMFQLPHCGAESLRWFAALAGAVPGYTLELGPNLEDIPLAVTEALARSEMPR
jgi:hypothetical protein